MRAMQSIESKFKWRNGPLHHLAPKRCKFSAPSAPWVVLVHVWFITLTPDCDDDDDDDGEDDDDEDDDDDNTSQYC